MKQRQMIFAALVTVFLLVAGTLLTLVVSDAGWKLILSGCLLATLCFVQGVFSGTNSGNIRKFAAATRGSRGH